MINRQDKKTCYDCKHKIIITEKEGYNLGGDEDIDYECIHSKVKYGFLARGKFDYENLAKTCRYFEPAEYEYVCTVCLEEFIFSQPKWEYWVKDMSEEPVCSKKCREKFYAKSK